MEIRSTGRIVRRKDAVQNNQNTLKTQFTLVSAVAFKKLTKNYPRNKGVQVFAASMADINKALAVKKRTDLSSVLPIYYHDFLDVFDYKKSESLPPLRGKGVDHAIDIENKNGQEAKIPWGPLYSISRKELLVLRKTLSELLDKGFIRVSNSPAAAPVLFVNVGISGLTCIHTFVVM